MDRLKGRIIIGTFILPILLLDIAILPVSPFFSLPFSVLIVIYLFIKYRHNIYRIQLPVLLFVSCLIVSTIFSLSFKDKYTLLNNPVVNILIDVHKEDVKRCIYLLLGVCIYRVVGIVYLENKFVVEKHINRVLLVICFVFAIMAVLFKTNNALFYQLKNIFFTVDVNMLNHEVLNYSGYNNRYSFILLDPNNACYFTLIIVIYLLENANLNVLTRIGVWLIAITSVLLTMSLGGAYAGISTTRV